MLEVRQLTKYYGKTRGIENISLSIGQREVYGLVGPNGAGKTTTLRLILGLLRPQNGSINLLGKGFPSSELMEKIGYCQAETNFYQDISPRALFRLIYRLRKLLDLSYAMELANLFSLPLDRKIKTLSMGNKQKINIIQAIMSKPELLIMDEPTVGLDPLNQNIFLNLIAELKESGTTILISSHQLYDIEKITDRIGFINDGSLVKETPTSDLSKEITSDITVVFKEEPPIEFFEENHITIKEKVNDNTFKITSVDINRDIPLIFKLSISDLKIKKLDLEEYFINFYREMNRNEKDA